ncbi:hypothetical protein E2C01_102240 [Portunus trituberculatus]|uniref:Uncharacterized protein n=1 Tax=Portunus trituberculatus TaxID=210409 RepID=A0A5B7KHX6_PORTR|nr:hypothetical protein [Portunus trituberculatus]
MVSGRKVREVGVMQESGRGEQRLCPYLPSSAVPCLACCALIWSAPPRLSNFSFRAAHQPRTAAHFTTHHHASPTPPALDSP